MEDRSIRGLFVVFIGVCFILFSIPFILNNLKLRFNGEKTKGVITDKYIRKTDEGDEHYIAVSYIIKNDTFIHPFHSLQQISYFTIGDSIDLFYSKTDKTNIQIDLQRNITLLIVFIFAGTCCVSTGIYIYFNPMVWKILGDEE